MKTESFIDQYFDMAMKIHAFCSDHSISKDDAKLYVYIYVKATESALGTAYFEQDCSAEITALKSLLKHSYDDAIVFEEDSLTPKMLLELYESFVNKSLHKIEQDMRQEYGLESVFTSELFNRLRLHTDDQFRKKHIDFFNNILLPGLADYNDSKIKISNINYQLKIAQEEKIIDLLTKD